MLAESMSDNVEGELLQATPWTDFHLNQLTWRPMAHRISEPDQSILDHLRRLPYRVGVTRTIECTNQKLRARFQDAATDPIGTMETDRTMTLGDVFRKRGRSCTASTWWTKTSPSPVIRRVVGERLSPHRRTQVLRAARGFC